MKGEKPVYCDCPIVALHPSQEYLREEWEAHGYKVVINKPIEAGEDGGRWE